MKNAIYIKISMILFFSLSLFSCSKEDGSVSNESENVVVAKSREASLQGVLNELRALANFEGKRVAFDLEYSEDGIYSSSNIRLIENDFAGDFEVAMFTQSDQPLPPGTVTVSCDTGSESPTVTYCPPDSNQGSCVGTATINCLNKNGCATSCKVPAIIAPDHIGSHQ